jgi:hypothetical protein
MKKISTPKNSLQEQKRPRQKVMIRLGGVLPMSPEEQARFIVAARALLAEMVRQADQKMPAATEIFGGTHEK